MAGAGKTVSTGVGLANIRDRLAQAYGDDHRFDIRTPPEGGFTVVIEIPYERGAPTPRHDRETLRPPAVTAVPDQRRMGTNA